MGARVNTHTLPASQHHQRTTLCDYTWSILSSIK